MIGTPLILVAVALSGAAPCFAQVNKRTSSERRSLRRPQQSVISPSS